MSKRGLRSRLAKYGDDEFSLFLRRGFLKGAGYDDEALSKPVVGILSTASDFNPCHRTAPQLAEAVKEGVLAAGALPFVFPTISLQESFAFPSSMLWRNLMAMDVEAMCASLPMDAVVLIGGCDKTIPAELMGAISADLPAIVLPVGPMLAGRFEGTQLGACTDCRRLWASFRAGSISEHDLNRAHDQLMPTAGTCMVMGTASTMATIAETLGFTLPGEPSRPPCPPSACGSRPPPAAAPPKWPGPAGRNRPNSSRSNRCATPPSCCRRSRARRTPSCISRRLPDAPASLSICRNSTPSAAKCRCWSISSRPVRNSRKIFTPAVRCPRCGEGCATSSISRQNPFQAKRSATSSSAGRNMSTMKSSARSTVRSSRAWRLRRSPAISRRKARSSNFRPRRLRSLRTRAPPSCSIHSTISRSASTIRTLPSRPIASSCCRTRARWARRACRKPARCRSRRSSARRA